MSEILREKAFAYVIQTPPVNPAVTLADFKAYAKITNNAEEATLQLILNSAIAFCQVYTRRVLITTEFKTLRDEFIQRANYIELRKSPFQSLTSFKYYNEANVLVDVDPETFMLTQETDYSKIAIFDGKAWPADVNSARPFQAIEIIFKSGYGDTTESVPAELKIGIMAHALNVARNRGDCADSCGAGNMPSTSSMIYNQFRIREIRLGF